MANTKTTTPTSRARAGVAVLGLAMGGFAAINLFMTMTPVAKRSAQIDTAFEDAQALPEETKLGAFRELEKEQTEILAQNPSDPYGWARLSYLRLETTGDKPSAFSALAMSDTVSPYEAPELPERAVMWYRYRDVESPGQQAYQDALWQKAYSLEPDLTWQAAVRNNLVAEAGDSLKKTDPALYDSWASRQAAAH